MSDRAVASCYKASQHSQFTHHQEMLLGEMPLNDSCRLLGQMEVQQGGWDFDLAYQSRTRTGPGSAF